MQGFYLTWENQELYNLGQKNLELEKILKKNLEFLRAK